MGADKEVLPHSCKIEGVNKIKRPEEEELVVDWRRRDRRCTEALVVSPTSSSWHVHQVGRPSKDLDLLANYNNNINTNSKPTTMTTRGRRSPHPQPSCKPAGGRRGGENSRQEEPGGDGGVQGLGRSFLSKNTCIQCLVSCGRPGDWDELNCEKRESFKIQIV